MYLTEMVLKPNRVNQLKEANNLAKSHEWFAKSLYINYKKPERYLWRFDVIDDDLHAGQKTLKLRLISSEIPLVKILAKYGRENTIKTQVYQPDLTNLQNKDFKIWVMPSKRIKRTHQQLFLADSDEQQAWFERKAIANGFKVTNISQVKQLAVPYQHFNNKSVAKVHLVEYTGKLEVTNLNKFKQALTHGIGRGKCYGLGMLWIND